MNDAQDPCFNDWSVLEAGEIARVMPSGAASFQVRQAEGLVRYPRGKSAMVYYAYAHRAQEALLEVMRDEIDEPGVRGQGVLWFRMMEHPRAHEHLERLYVEFERRFGAPPLFNSIS